MSSRNPIIAVTGSSGAGTSTTTEAFEHIFRSLGIRSAQVEGDSFHRYSRQEMDLEALWTFFMFESSQPFKTSGKDLGGDWTAFEDLSSVSAWFPF